MMRKKKMSQRQRRNNRDDSDDISSSSSSDSSLLNNIDDEHEDGGGMKTMNGFHTDAVAQQRHDSSGTTTTSTPAALDDDDCSVTLNELDEDHEPDKGAISLLKQIFPDEATEHLRQMHLDRCRSGHLSSREEEDEDEQAKLDPTISSSIGAPQEQRRNNNEQLSLPPPPPPRIRRRRRAPQVELPVDFLRLPSSVAVRRFLDGQWQYKLVQELEQRAFLQHERCCCSSSSSSNGVVLDSFRSDYFTKVVARSKDGGLGMTLIEDEHGLVRVHALVGGNGGDTTRQVRNNAAAAAGWETPSAKSKGTTPGPALQAGIQTGDFLIGIEGVAFSESVAPNESSLVVHAVSMIRSAPDPVVLHLLRPTTTTTTTTAAATTSTDDAAPQTPVPHRVVIPLPILLSSPSLLDTSDLLTEPPHSADVSFQSSDLSCSQATPIFNNTANSKEIHPFIELLADARLVESTDEQRVLASRMLHNFEVRNRQWEDMSCFASSSQDFHIPLVGVRKALSVRIVNMFKDGAEAAYTLWVYDIDSAKEWYAPVRYLRDFEDLRAATLPLCSSVGTIPFPTANRGPLGLFRSPSRGESDLQQETKCRQLEFFLRTLCSMIYKEKLHPFMAEIAVLVQSFLGCDERALHNVDPEVPATVGGPESSRAKNEQAHQTRVRKRLKSHIQRYTYRLFLLDAMGHAVDRFVDTFRTRGPKMQDIEALEAKGSNALKTRAMQDLEHIQTFLDKLQDMILDGCMEDFQLIAGRDEFAAIHPLIRTEASYWERLVREAVREQVEIEVYVPLRSVVSRWLVNGWRHEDMEVLFKIKELRKRPQEFFRIVKGDNKRHDWSTVSAILNEGVGLSTLPCVKLRAIVDAAREIVRIFSSSENKSELSQGHHHPQQQSTITKEALSTTTTMQNGSSAVVAAAAAGHNLGADDFLPIFIYCVVQAEMERPCALCVLLRTLCDRINKIGEIGYYLLTFEAAITHCQEVDLTEDREEMHSFVSVPLNDDS